MCCALTRATTTVREHTYRWPRTRPYPEPSRSSAALFPCRSSADCITITSGSDLRQPQHFFHVGGRVADVDNLQPTPSHNERRLLYCVVADRDNQVRLVDCLVHVITLRKRGRAHVKA